MRTMKAAVLHGREDVRIESVPVPAIVGGEVLLRNHVALTCGTDVKVFRRGYHARMIVPPAIFGHEVSGVVEEIGPEVDNVRPGTAVVVANSAPCGLCEYCRKGKPNLCDDLLFWNGAYAEYSRIPARLVQANLVLHPAGMTHRQAAMVEPLACAIRGIGACEIERGQTVAVIGVGALGLMLVALAHRAGATVVALGRNRDRLLRAQALGADETVSTHDEPDLVSALRRRSSGGRGPEVVIEAAGTRETAEAALRAVRKGGLVNLFAGCPADTRLTVDAPRLHYDELTVKSTFHHTPTSVREAVRLVTKGEVDPEAFITGEASLDQVPEVFRRLALAADGLKTAILPLRG
jgi:L-iditol 2-dehydrogenase